MIKSHRLLVLPVLIFITACSGASKKEEAPAQAPVAAAAQPQLTKITEFKEAQVTGITVSSTGRLFANFPRWRENIPYSVVEVLPNGEHKPYPNEKFNRWSGKPEKNQFTCVQSVVAHGGSLFVLDPGSPMLAGVIGKARLFEFDLRSNRLLRTWEFDSKIAPAKSYLNDLRIDDKSQRIFITDSGLGAIVIVNMKNGSARRVLAESASTKSEKITLDIGNNPFLIGGEAPQIHSDGIEISKDHLYFHALTGYTLYRVPLKALLDNSLEEAKLEEQVENLGRTPAPDGMMFDKNGNLYMADLEKSAVVYRTPKGEIKTLIQDERVKWADTFAIDQKGNLLFSASRLMEISPGQPAQGMFPIYSVPLAPAN